VYGKIAVEKLQHKMETNVRKVGNRDGIYALLCNFNH